MSKKCLLSECLKSTISKDETRPALMGVIHYSPLQALVSCNGTSLTVLKDHYRESLKDVIIDVNAFVPMDGREYPRVESVFNPSRLKEANNFKTMTVHFTKFHTRKSAKKAENTLTFFVDGTMSFDGESASDQEIAFHLNSSFIKPLCIGQDFKVYYTNSMSPVAFEIIADRENYLVIMPIKL